MLFSPLDPASEPTVAQDSPYLVLQAVVSLGGAHSQQVVMHRANILVYGDLVVVENYQKVRTGSSGVIYAFVCEASGEGSVSKNCNYFCTFP